MTEQVGKKATSGLGSLSSRTSLRASTMRYAGFTLNERGFSEDDEEPPTTRRSGRILDAPRIVKRAALNVALPEDILSACVGVELVSSELGLSPRVTGALSHVVCELGQNLLRHARGGTIAIAQLLGPIRGIEIFAQDQGPGIEGLESWLSARPDPDPGQPRGLRGVSQLADEFDVQSGPTGTHVRVVIYG